MRKGILTALAALSVIVQMYAGDITGKVAFEGTPPKPARRQARTFR